MGNGFGKLTDCLSRRTTPHRRSHHGDVIGTLVSDPYLCSDEGFGHSFCYVRPVESQEDPPPPPVAAGFRAISGASVSANTSTAPFSSSSIVLTSETASAAAFDSSESFFSVPLQPVPRLLSGPLDRGFLSGPIERGFMSGPIDPNSLNMGIFSGPLSGEHHHHFNLRRSFSSKPWLLKGLGKVFRRSISRGHKVVSFSSKELESAAATLTSATTTTTTTCSSSSTKLSGCNSFDRSSSEEEQSGNLHWAQGKAGEDRVHVVVSEEEGWVFVGIYDGFNGPDATDYLLSNLYSSMSEQLKGVALEEKAVFEAMKKALRKTEEGFLGIADKVVVENPELALMGSCVLAMVMKGDVVYLMNVGDSRAVVGRAAAAPAADEEEVTVVEQPMSSERTHHGLEALQLTVEHSTSVEEELCRIRKEHPEDANAIVNDRVKGSLKVTRAFGAGFLKKPKWNDALLEMFRVDYVGNSPYITCDPSLSHHKLDHRDRFLILSSDGLYQYFTNEEAAVEVEAFMATSPEGDPAQHLIEEVLFRAAKKAGLDFHELLAIPQGDRRRYHDDVSVIVISLEGRIWRSSM